MVHSEQLWAIYSIETMIQWLQQQLLPGCAAMTMTQTGGKGQNDDAGGRKKKRKCHQGRSI